MALKLGIIGFGNMAEMIAKGLLKKESITDFEVSFYTPNPTKQALIEQTYHFSAKKSAKEVYQWSDIILLAVKPQKLSEVAIEIGEVCLKENAPLILSVLAGVKLQKLSALFSNERIVRIMPNTAASVYAAVSTLSANECLDKEDRRLAEQIFNSVGTSQWIDEAYLDATSALNGSAPAFLYLVAEALADGGVKNGLSRPLAESLIAEVFIGVGKMLKESGKSSFELKTQVSSPGGMTIEGLSALEAHGVRYGLIEAVTKAKERSEELGKEA